jgi:hypothetical protein
MRLWSIHPKYLDAAGLTALWRESLLARKVLAGGTIGYRNHPQLERFKKTSEPAAMLDTYLQEVYKEARSRGYKFDASKIGISQSIEKMPITAGQLEYELGHLLSKLEKRSPLLFNKYCLLRAPEPHPVFIVVSGKVEPWERIGNNQS